MAFEGLTEKLSYAFKKLRGKGRLSEADVKESMREIRLALVAGLGSPWKDVRVAVLAALGPLAADRVVRAALLGHLGDATWGECAAYLSRRYAAIVAA